MVGKAIPECLFEDLLPAFIITLVKDLLVSCANKSSQIFKGLSSESFTIRKVYIWKPFTKTDGVGTFPAMVAEHFHPILVRHPDKSRICFLVLFKAYYIQTVGFTIGKYSEHPVPKAGFKDLITEVIIPLLLNSCYQHLQGSRTTAGSAGRAGAKKLPALL